MAKMLKISNHREDVLLNILHLLIILQKVASGLRNDKSYACLEEALQNKVPSAVCVVADAWTYVRKQELWGSTYTVSI